MRISNVCCCELLVTSASVSALASVWPRPSHRPGNYWISRPAPLIYLPIISLHLRHVRQSVKIFVDKGPDINLLNLLYNSVFGVKAEMVKWRRHVFQSLLRLLSNTAYMSADGVPVSLSPYLRGSEPCLGISWRWHTSHNTGDMQQECIMGSPNTQHPTQFNT